MSSLSLRANHGVFSAKGRSIFLNRGFSNAFFESRVKVTKVLILFLIVNYHPLGFEIIDQKIIEFFSYLKNPSEDVHLRAISYCGMPTSSYLSTLCQVLEGDLIPLLCGDIEFPQIS